MHTDSKGRDPENYLRITRLTRALLLNFGTRSLEYKRLIFTPEGICGNLSQSAEEVPV